MQPLSPKQLGELLDQKIERFHLIGVAGSGMSGLAALLLEQGYHVSGSDLKRSDAVDRLVQKGLAFFEDHSPENLKDAQMVVYSSAVSIQNVERVEAEKRSIPQARRGELLAALVKNRDILAVAGAHGKTTSSTMLTHILEACGKNPSFYIGAEVPSFQGSARWGKGKECVIELDESDGTFVAFSPAHTLVLNIELEHLDFFTDIEAIRAAFEKLGNQTTGKLIYCRDDQNATALFSSRSNAISYGFNATADYRIVQLELNEKGSFFVLKKAGAAFHVKLEIPGRHNASNVAGVLALADQLGVDIRKAVEALTTFQNACRRFDVLFESPDFMVVNDYAHHPSEIQATIAAAKLKNRKRIIGVFQPHRYSRVSHLYQEFLAAFEGLDQLFLTDIYAASEQPIEGVSGKRLADDLASRQNVIFCGEVDDARAAAALSLQPGDLLLVMGAGDVERVAQNIAGTLSLLEKLKAIVSPETVVKPFEPMRKHTSMRVGGPTGLWIEPASEKDLSEVVRYASKNSVPMTFIGRGTNLLIKDRGLPGICIHLSHPSFNKIEVSNGRIHAGAGVRLKLIVAEAKKAGIGGLEFMEGIPASLGGALRMNAGAMTSATFNVVESVVYMDMEGNVHTVTSSEIEVNYRSVPLFRTNIALEAVLKGTDEVPEKIAEVLNTYSKKRWSSQPAAPSAGCIFKNPETIQAGKLIDQLGLKDTAVGAARVSSVHGNFIVNEGGATAKDILALIEQIKEKARQERGIELKTEVIILGE